MCVCVLRSFSDSVTAHLQAAAVKRRQSGRLSQKAGRNGRGGEDAEEVVRVHVRAPGSVAVPLGVLKLSVLKKKKKKKHLLGVALRLTRWGSLSRSTPDLFVRNNTFI